MLDNITLERLRSFRINGFIDEFLQQSKSSKYLSLSFEERLTLLVDAEHTKRVNQKIIRLIQGAKLPQRVALDDVDFNSSRTINKKQILEICQGSWLTNSNVIITGQTGVGKTFLASVICQELCLRSFSVKFRTTNQWLLELVLADEKRKLPQAITSLKKTNLLVFDDWLRDPVSSNDSRRLIDLFDARYKKSACLFTSQLPVHDWHKQFNDPTLADALLDRIVHNSIRIDLQGESMRKAMSPSKNLAEATS